MIQSSRQQFCPAGNWLLSKEIDLDLFVKMIMIEDDEEFQYSHLDDPPIILKPYLSLLKEIPFVIPFDTRVQIFREWVRKDRERYDTYF